MKLTAAGRAAHAGTDPDAGVNAVALLAPEVTRIQALNQARPGLTAQVTGFRGGVGINTVPPEACSTSSWLAKLVPLPVIVKMFPPGPRTKPKLAPPSG